MCEFTKGKWVADIDTVLTEDREHCIAEVRGSSCEEVQANARLIASAPEMYKVISELHYLSGIYDFYWDKVGDIDLDKLLKFIEFGDADE